MRKHGPLPGNQANPWFIRQVQRRRRREKAAKKARQVQYAKARARR